MSLTSPLHWGLPAIRLSLIPHLIAIISQHLEPDDVFNCLLVCRDFHAAFLPCRWRVLATDFFGDIDKNSNDKTLFPQQPTKEAEAALRQYGARLAREVQFGHYRDRLGELLLLPLQEEATTESTTTVRCDYLPHRLDTIKLAGIYPHSRVSHWMHWDEYEDDYNFRFLYVKHKLVEKVRVRRNGQDNLCIIPRTLVLSLAGRNRSTLRKLCLEDLATTIDNPTAFSAQLTQLLCTVSRLEVLRIGPVSTEDLLNVFIHMPSGVQDLTLTAITPRRRDHDGSMKQSEQLWAKYQEDLRKQLLVDGFLSDEPDNDDRGEVGHLLERIRGKSIQSVMETMVAPKLRLERLRLSLVTKRYPALIVCAILRLCPNLTSFRLPYFYDDDVDNLIEVLKEGGVGKRLEHLDFTGYVRGREQHLAKIIDTVSPKPQQLDSSFASLTGTTTITSTTTTATRALSEQNWDDGSGTSPRIRNGLRSLIFKNIVFGHVLHAALSVHFSTLERISVVGCGSKLTSSDILTWLKRCPSLGTLLLIEPGMPDPTLWQSIAPKVDWIDFQTRGTDPAGNNTHDRKSTSISSTSSSSNTDLETAMTRLPEMTTESSFFRQEQQEQQDLQLQPLESISATLSSISLQMSGICVWPCTRTLRVLSIFFSLDLGDFNREQVRSYMAGIYHRLGQLVALEDLALGSDTWNVSFRDPWSVVNDNKDENRQLKELVANQEYCLVSLDCSLAQGLEHMSGLKRLRRLNVSSLPLCRIGAEEVEWMKSRWPRFNSLVLPLPRDKNE